MLAYPNKSPDEQPIASHRDRSIVRLKLRWDIVYGDPIPAHYQAINPLSYYRFTEPSKAFSGCASLHEARQVPGTHTNSKNIFYPSTSYSSISTLKYAATCRLSSSAHAGSSMNRTAASRPRSPVLWRSPFAAIGVKGWAGRGVSWPLALVPLNGLRGWPIHGW